MRFSKLAAAAALASTVSAQASPCDKYTTILLTNNTAANQYALVTLLVKSAALGNFTGPNSTTSMGYNNTALPGSLVNFKGFLTPAMYNGSEVNLAKYFTGAVASTNVNGAPAAVNWLDSNATELVADPLSLGASGTNANLLLTHLVQYFGALLQCSFYGTTNFSAYQGSNNQYEVHQYMDLSEAEFSYFINQTGESALSFGAEVADVESIAMSLNTLFGYRCSAPTVVVPDTPAMQQVMCIGTGCPLAASPTAGCSGLAANGTVVPSMASTVTASATIDLNTMNPSGTTTAGSSGPLAQASTNAAGAMSSAAAAASSSTGNAAPLQTAAAGIVAGAAAIAAALL